MRLTQVFSMIEKVAPDGDPLEHHLMFAFAFHESNFEAAITRYEPGWKYFYKTKDFAEVLLTTEDTEKVHQATSWGLMQIMGTVARELGYEGHLPALIDPLLNLTYGVKKIRLLRKKYSDINDIISAYNSGNPIKNNGIYINQKYVDSVYRRLSNITSVV